MTTHRIVLLNALKVHREPPPLREHGAPQSDTPSPVLRDRAGTAARPSPPRRQPAWFHAST